KVGILVLDFHFSTAQKFFLCLAFILNFYRVFAAARRAFRGAARNSAFGQGIPADALHRRQFGSDCQSCHTVTVGVTLRAAGGRGREYQVGVTALASDPLVQGPVAGNSSAGHERTPAAFGSVSRRCSYDSFRNG